MTRIMIVYPHEGVDKIRFGMSRADVERAMQMVPMRFKRSNFSFEEDHFMSLGIGVMYDEHGTCNTIGIMPGFGTDWEYDGYLLLSHPAREVRDWALARDPNLDPKEGFTSKALGLNMWADWLDAPEPYELCLMDPAQSFLAFRPGYYEEEQKRLAALNITDEGWFSKNG